ncbi:MAG: hypothetical protein QXY62_01595 [Candidatus Altiarchaeota archaeon]
MKIIEESYRLVMKDNNFTQIFLGILLIAIPLLLFFLVPTKNKSYNDLLVFYLVALMFFFSGILAIISRRTVLIIADKSKGLITLSSKSLFSRDEESFPFSEIDSILVQYYYIYGKGGSSSLRYDSMFILKNGRKIFFDEGGGSKRWGLLGNALSIAKKRDEFEKAKKIATFIGVEAKEQWPINPIPGVIELGREILNKFSDHKSLEEIKTEIQQKSKEVKDRANYI